MQYEKQMLREKSVCGKGYSLIMLNAIVSGIMCLQDVLMRLIYHVINVTVLLHVYWEPGESILDNEDAEMEATSLQYSLLCDYHATFEIFIQMTGELKPTAEYLSIYCCIIDSAPFDSST